MDIIDPLPRTGGRREDDIMHINFTAEELIDLINSIHAKRNPKLLKQSQ